VRLLDLATYPVARPLSGRQLRRNAIARAYREAGIAVRLCAIYDRRIWRDDNDIQQKFLKTKPRTGWGSEPAGARGER